MTRSVVSEKDWEVKSKVNHIPKLETYFQLPKIYGGAKI